MIELEILVEVFDEYEYVDSILSKFENTKNEHIIDQYFYDPLRKNLKPNGLGKTFECLRVRENGSSAKLTYKRDVYKNEVWQYSNENEINIENANSLKEILFNLGFNELLTIDNNRKYYSFENYEIVLEKVKKLGVFMEIEYKSDITEIEIENKRQEIQAFINDLNIKVSDELNAGKPELYIIKNKIKIE